ncbi:E3 ubiquitin-protein ligase RNF4 [Pseudolycoriella hygida]|uniref:E3 ubiquitin-protein ligase RNF4 n=1 Tax=Pseudolycoriella hygida TaxID=35572 RepID=A0A9Q0MTJ5_9DIPT|nr:E3 ubiquitin-protein ligase RNF4 [Pseudolycoriella hygida]
MDSVYNDLEFLMGNIKDEPPNSNENAEPHPGGTQHNETDQLSMSNYMTDFILDYINRSLKNEVDGSEEVDEGNRNEADEVNPDESVDALIQRAESMIRENMQENVVDANASDPRNQWMEPLNVEDGTSVVNPSYSEQIMSIPSSSNYATVSRPPIANEAPPEVVLVDTDSEDEVIFVNSAIPIIDLSDQLSPENRIESTRRAHSGTKRTYDTVEINCDSPAPPPTVPVEKPPEKKFRHSCAICLDDVKSAHSTVCGHIYCGPCIKEAVKLFKKCPTCNKKLKTSNVHPIYL